MRTTLADQAVLASHPEMEALAPLLGRTLVLVAHPDDEAVACGGLLQRMREPVVVICTDGAPRDEFFWREYGSRVRYAAVREQEAREALHHVGGGDPLFLHHLQDGSDIFVDQELCRRLPQAVEMISDMIVLQRPDAILAPAYEGGHPDHDACNFIAAVVGREYQIPVWEVPLYQREPGETQFQRFVRPRGNEVLLDISGEELERKLAMWDSYVSQRTVLTQFVPELEIFRPLAAYDYSSPPHEGKLVYEAWGWPIRGWELCDHFRQFYNSRDVIYGGLA